MQAERLQGGNIHAASKKDIIVSQAVVEQS
jgi:hypothetical protein